MKILEFFFIKIGKYVNILIKNRVCPYKEQISDISFFNIFLTSNEGIFEGTINFKILVYVYLKEKKHNKNN